MKSFMGSLLLLALALPAGAAPAADPRPALVSRFDLSLAGIPADPGLRRLTDFSRMHLNGGNENAFLFAQPVLIGQDAPSFSDQSLVLLLNGRINGRFDLDFSITDAEAAVAAGSERNSGLVVMNSERVYCSPRDAHENARMASKILKHFRPAGNAHDADDVGIDWKELKKAEAILNAIVTDCDYSVSLLSLHDDYDASLNLLALQRNGTAEILLIGFGANP